MIAERPTLVHLLITCGVDAGAGAGAGDGSALVDGIEWIAEGRRGQVHIRQHQ